MAAAWFNALADPAKAHAISAGTQPGDRVHPVVVDVMREAGIDLSGNRPQRLTADLAAAARCSSRWAAATSARSCPGSQSTTGRCPIRKASPSTRCVRSATTCKRRVLQLLQARGWARRNECAPVASYTDV